MSICSYVQGEMSFEASNGRFFTMHAQTTAVDCAGRRTWGGLPMRLGPSKAWEIWFGSCPPHGDTIGVLGVGCGPRWLTVSSKEGHEWGFQVDYGLQRPIVSSKEGHEWGYSGRLRPPTANRVLRTGTRSWYVGFKFGHSSQSCPPKRYTFGGLWVDCGLQRLIVSSKEVHNLVLKGLLQPPAANHVLRTGT